MSHWQEKSESNFNATNKLNLESFFCSSVHCSYYSCVQLMYHLLRSQLEKTDKQIREESYEGSKIENGLHNWLINTFFKEFTDTTEANLFNTTISDLQALRVKSDYKNKKIIEGEAIAARDKAYLTISILKRNFKV